MKLFRKREPDWANHPDASTEDMCLRIRQVDQPKVESKSLRRLSSSNGINGGRFMNQRDRQSRFVVATVGQQPVGYARFTILGTGWNDWMWLDEVVVDASHRRSRIGRALVTDALAWGATFDVPICETYPKDGRADRVAFFTSLGFRPDRPDGKVYSVELSQYVRLAHNPTPN